MNLSLLIKQLQTLHDMHGDMTVIGGLLNIDENSVDTGYDVLVNAPPIKVYDGKKTFDAAFLTFRKIQK